MQLAILVFLYMKMDTINFLITFKRKFLRVKFKNISKNIRSKIQDIKLCLDYSKIFMN